jgi:hypothetical protein
VSPQTTRPRGADPDALDALAGYRAARDRGEWRRLELAGADLRGVDVSELNLDECDLAGTLLDGARFVGASLVRSNLAGASLLGADFSYANLDRADLEGADATAASFVSATLRRANLGRCKLHRADLSDADISHANLYEADLKAASLVGTLAAQANFRGSVLEDAVLTSLRGEPLFSELPDVPQAESSTGWPAARLRERQLVELAELFLSTHGWWIVEPSSWGEGVDLVAQRDGSLVFVQVKSTMTPSSQTFAHLAQRLRRSAEEHPGAQLILVMPGPLPKTIEELARVNEVSVLGVWIDDKTMHVEEITGTESELPASA